MMTDLSGESRGPSGCPCPNRAVSCARFHIRFTSPKRATGIVCARLCPLPDSVPADPLYGVWKTRPSGKPGDTSKQTMTIEPVAAGIKFTTDIDFGRGGAGMSTTYVTKLDGADVPVYSAGEVVMALRGKRTGPNTCEGSVTGPGGTGTSKTTLSADCKTMTVDVSSVDRRLANRNQRSRIHAHSAR